MGHREYVVPAERRCPGEQFEGHDSGGVDIAARTDGSPLNLFGREVAGRPEDDARRGDPGLGNGPHQPEVDQFDLAVIGDQHILRFDVAVHQSGPMGHTEAAEDRMQHGRHGMRRHRSPFPQQFAKRAAVDEFHDQKRMGGVVALVVNCDQSRVFQSGDRAGFSLEAGQELVVAGVPGVHHLQGHLAVESQIKPSVDRRHPSGRNTTLDAIAAVENRAEERVRRHRPILSRPPRRTRCADWWDMSACPVQVPFRLMR